MSFAKFYLPKISGGLSLVGSAIIIAEVLAEAAEARRSTQRTSSNGASGRSIATASSRLLLSMSIGDVLYSLGWVFGTWLSPSDLDYLEGTNHGTRGSCIFQGFIMTLGMSSSLLFNAAFAASYLSLLISITTKGRTITTNDNKSCLPRYEPLVQGILWAVCLAASIFPLTVDMYHNTGPVCLIDSYPDRCTESWQIEAGVTPYLELDETDCTAGDNAQLVRLILLFLPLLLTIVFVTAVMVMIYAKVRHLEVTAAPHLQLQRSSSFFSASMRHIRSAATRSVEDVPESVDPDDSSGSDSDDSDIGYKLGEEQHAPYFRTRRNSALRTSTRSASTMGSRSSNYNRRRSRAVAHQGALYVAGFLLCFSWTLIGLILWSAFGIWSDQFDYASFFFMSSQGIWNFFIFSQRRTMKTAIGRTTRLYLWGSVLLIWHIMVNMWRHPPGWQCLQNNLPNTTTSSSIQAKASPANENPDMENTSLPHNYPQSKRPWKDPTPPKQLMLAAGEEKKDTITSSTSPSFGFELLLGRWHHNLAQLVSEMSLESDWEDHDLRPRRPVRKETEYEVDNEMDRSPIWDDDQDLVPRRPVRMETECEIEHEMDRSPIAPQRTKSSRNSEAQQDPQVPRRPVRLETEFEIESELDRSPIPPRRSTSSRNSEALRVVDEAQENPGPGMMIQESNDESGSPRSVLLCLDHELMRANNNNGNSQRRSSTGSRQSLESPPAMPLRLASQADHEDDGESGTIIGPQVLKQRHAELPPTLPSRLPSQAGDDDDDESGRLQLIPNVKQRPDSIPSQPLRMESETEFPTEILIEHGTKEHSGDEIVPKIDRHGSDASPSKPIRVNSDVLLMSTIVEDNDSDDDDDLEWSTSERPHIHESVPPMVEFPTDEHVPPLVRFPINEAENKEMHGNCYSSLWCLLSRVTPPIKPERHESSIEYEV